MTPTFSIIVPTTGRLTLERALRSLAAQPLMPGDDVLVIGPDGVAPVVAGFGFRHVPCATGGHFGCEERNLGISLASASHLAFLDDDDAYMPGALDVMRRIVAQYPDRPVMFKMITDRGIVLWRTPTVALGNHGTPQFVTPNVPGRVGEWSERYEGDFDFCVSTLAAYPSNALVWHTEVVCACRAWADRVWESSRCVTS